MAFELNPKQKEAVYYDGVKPLLIEAEIRINDDLALMIEFDDDLQFVEPNENTDYYLYNVSKDEIPDPHALTIVTKVNGEIRQNGSTKDMMFTVSDIIEIVSKYVTLEPGDVILTGTPAGVGKGMNPPQFLKAGDEVKISIEGIGTLANRFA